MVNKKDNKEVASRTKEYRQEEDFVWIEECSFDAAVVSYLSFSLE